MSTDASGRWTADPATPVVTAPDGSTVRPLLAGGRASMAHGVLPPGLVSRAIRHRTVQEDWYVVAGTGRLWRRLAGREEVVELAPDVACSIPVGTDFQFRCDGDAPLVFVMATVPAWPGDDEAETVDGLWQPSLTTPCR